MNNSRTQPILIIGDGFKRVAAEACALIRNGNPEAIVRIDLPETPAMQLVVCRYAVARRYTGALPNRQPEGSLCLSFCHEPMPCADCCASVDRLRVSVGDSAGLAAYFQEIAQRVYQHGCLRPSVERADTHSQTGSRSVKDTEPETRVKLLPQAERAVAQAEGSALAPRPVAKVVTPGGRGRLAPSHADQDAETVDDSLHTAPSFHYALADGNEVEVTIPMYVCSALINESNQSNLQGREIGGILVGHRYEVQTETASTHYHVFVTDLIPGKATDSSSSHITLSEESWSRVFQVFDARYKPQNKVSLGWYHTHPYQGIFFSTPDRDSHTTFRLPYQFALVIDPQKMEAGFFYWSDYFNQKLSGPVRFELKRERHPASSDPFDGIGDPEPASLSKPRLLLAAGLWAGAAACVYSGTGASASSVSPANACLLALAALVWARVWSGGFFHPQQAIEVIFANIVKRRIRSFGDAALRMLQAHKRKVVAAALLISILGGLSYFRRKRDSRSEDAEARSMTVDTNPSSKGESDVRRVSLSLQALVEHSQLFQLKLDPADLEVDYVVISGRRNRQDVIRVSDPQKEAAFFAELLGFQVVGDGKDPAGVKRFQMAMDLDKEANGVWGEAIRHAFLRKALISKNSKQPMLVRLSGSRLLQIKFD